MRYIYVAVAGFTLEAGLLHVTVTVQSEILESKEWHLSVDAGVEDEDMWSRFELEPL
jgi:hypothetical protein